MRKITFLFTLLLVIFITRSMLAQTQLIFDDFEAYTVGQKLVQQTTETFWTTWSNSPGSSEDADVSDEQSYNGSNSLKIVTDNDIVLLLNDKTTGRYQIEFYIYVVSGNVAYFNILQDFNGANSEWGMQTFFNTDGSGTVDAGGESAGTFSFNHNEWIYVNAIVDVDDDLATLYIGGDEIVSWQWSGGSYGASSLEKLDAVNLYGWEDDNNNGSLFYVDDIEFIEQVALNSPTNLQAVVSDDNISLTWDAPSPGTPDNYSLIRNNSIIANGITTTNYDNNNLYPNTYTYTVRAHYAGLGYSSSSNEAVGTVAGGIVRDLVVFEIATGTWCQYCPGAAMGADDMHANDHNVAIIEYHNGDDDYVNPDATGRINYYNVTGFPTTTVDGVLGFSGGSTTESLYPLYLNYYNERVNIPSVYNIDLDVVCDGGNDFTATINVEETNDYFTGLLTLHAVLTESHIPEFWHGQSEVNFVCRKMYPNSIGTSLDFSSQTTQTEVINFTVDPSYVINNCEFVVFIQHNSTKEIIQAAKVELAEYLGMEELNESSINIYPNPAIDKLTIEIESNELKDFFIEVFDIVGNKIYESKQDNKTTLKHTIDFSSQRAGIYLLKIRAGNSFIVRKFQLLK